MENDENKRRDTRVPFPGNVTVNGKVRFKGVDISKGGIYVHTGRSYKLGTVVDIFFQLKYESFNIQAKVQFNQPGVGMGLQFINLTIDENDKIVSYIDKMAAKMKEGESDRKKAVIIFGESNPLSMHKSELVGAGFTVGDIKISNNLYSDLESHMPINIIIVTLEMTKPEDFNVLKVIRASADMSEVPVLVISSNTNPAVMQQVTTAGADEIMSRMTASPRRLMEKVRQIVEG